jgi:hypothetical protein
LFHLVSVRGVPHRPDCDAGVCDSDDDDGTDHAGDASCCNDDADHAGNYDCGFSSGMWAVTV